MLVFGSIFHIIGLQFIIAVVIHNYYRCSLDLEKEDQRQKIEREKWLTTGAIIRIALKIEIKRAFVIFLAALFCILIKRP